MSVAMPADDLGTEPPVERPPVEKTVRETVGVSVVIPLVRVNSRPGEVVEGLSEVLDARGCTYEFLIVVT